MGEIYKSVLELIGNTPMISISEYTGGNVYGKCEFLNPGGSIKDRIALRMIEEAKKAGKLNKDSIICEPTSGNTGIGLSLVGNLMGYNVNIVMPENMSDERKKIIKALGADLILTPAIDNVGGAIKGVDKFVSENTDVYVPNQFENKTNPLAHYDTTAPEIYSALDGKVDIFIDGIGSGGTLSGVGKYLKEKNPNVVIVAVEPLGVSALKGDGPGPHKIEGIGDGFIPAVLDVSIIDEIVEVFDEDAIAEAKRLASECGLLVGISSGANVYAAKLMIEKYGHDKNIVIILADRAERYFSTDLFKGKTSQM